MSQSYGPTLVTDGLVFCVDAASNRSYPGNGTTWADLVGNNDGTLTNAPAFDSDGAGCISFDGTNDKIIHSADSSLSFGDGSTDDPFSFFAWIYLNTLDSPTIGGKYRSYSPFRGEYSLSIDDSAKLVFQTVDGGTSIRCRQVADAALVADRWYYVGGTYNANGADEGIILYVDGLAIPSTGAGQDGSYTAMEQAGDPSEFALGCVLDEGNTTYVRHLNGKIAAVQVYNKELSANEIRQNYHATKGRFGL